MKRNLSIVCLLALAFTAAAEEGIGWKTFKEPGSFVMTLARDGAGNIWVSTEGNGVWKFNPDAVTNQWTQFTRTAVKQISKNE